MIEITNDQVKEEFKKLREAFKAQFDLRLDGKQLSEEREDTLVVTDNGTSASSVQLPGTNRAKWLKKNAGNFGFNYDGVGRSKIIYVLFDGGTPEEKPEEKPAAPIINQSVTPRPQSQEFLSRRQARKEVEDGSAEQGN